MKRRLLFLITLATIAVGSWNLDLGICFGGCCGFSRCCCQPVTCCTCYSLPQCSPTVCGPSRDSGPAPPAVPTMPRGAEREGITKRPSPVKESGAGGFGGMAAPVPPIPAPAPASAPAKAGPSGTGIPSPLPPEPTPTPAIQPAPTPGNPFEPATPGAVQPAAPSGAGTTPRTGPNTPAPGSQSIARHIQENSGELTVWVPNNAKVLVNGEATRSTGNKRQFVSYGMKPGFHYRYEIRIELVRNEHPETEIRTVVLTAGQGASIAFGFNPNATRDRAELASLR